MSGFTHYDTAGNVNMVDIGNKEKTARQAKAVGTITMSAECYNMVRDLTMKKGDVLSVAQVAGIMAVKQTGDLIPLCHNIIIEKASIDFEFNDNINGIIAACVVKTTGSTGVEMEALTGVSVALLTIYDMCKAVDKSMEIKTIHLVEKTGGKSGTYIGE